MLITAHNGQDDCIAPNPYNYSKDNTNLFPDQFIATIMWAHSNPF